jgi:tripartite-type tricarboxylate transporter receptor subunit TctC
VPTFRSLGYPAIEVQGWAAIVAPKGTIPAEGLARLESLLAAALAAPAVLERFAVLSLAPLKMDRPTTARFLQEEAQRYAAIIKARGIKAE